MTYLISSRRMRKQRETITVSLQKTVALLLLKYGKQFCYQRENRIGQQPEEEAKRETGNRGCCSGKDENLLGSDQKVSW